MHAPLVNEQRHLHKTRAGGKVSVIWAGELSTELQAENVPSMAPEGGGASQVPGYKVADSAL
jgi:hypothetical protein